MRGFAAKLTIFWYLKNIKSLYASPAFYTHYFNAIFNRDEYSA